MSEKTATVKEPVSSQVPVGSMGEAGSSVGAEEVRLRLAAAWGEMGAAWGVAPAIARVHAYLMARAAPLTEREVREALGLSHRAASLALDEAVAWGIVERVDRPRRVRRRGPAGVAFQAVGDHWQWFARVIAERKAREGDPIIAVLERTAAEAARAALADPDDEELAALAAWLSRFLGFVRLFDRAVDLVPVVPARELERLLALLARIPDERILQLVAVLDAVPDEDILALLDAVASLPSTAARRATGLIAAAARVARKR